MLELLDEFYCVANHMNITKAALALNMSQSNLSRHVRQLEREVGFQLLDRNSGNIKLTRAGRRLADGYPDIRRSVDELIGGCRSLADSNARQIIAHEPPYMDNVVSPYYDYLRNLCGNDAQIEFRMLQRVSLREALDNRTINVGVAYFYPEVPNSFAHSFSCDFLCDVPLSVWTSKSAPLSRLDVAHIDDIAQYRIIMPNDSYHPLKKGIEALFEKFDAKPSYEIINTLTQTEFMTAKSQGCVFIFPLALKDDPRLKARFDLQCVPLAPELALHAYAVSNKGE